MDIQELALKSIVTQIRHPVSARFPDIRGQLITELQDVTKFEHWAWGDDGIRLWPEDGSAAVICASRETRVANHRLEDRAAFETLALDVFKVTLNRLDVTEIDFIGTRSYWAAAVDSFEAIRGWLTEHLSPELTSLYGHLGKGLTDIGWVLEFHDADPKITVRVGPAKKEQVSALVAPEAVDHYPPDFLFLDFDRVFNERKTASAEFVDHWVDNLTKNLDAAEKLGASLTKAGGSTETVVR